MFAVPQFVIKGSTDPVMESVNVHKPTAIFLQLDPLLYLSRCRFLHHTAATITKQTTSKFTMKNYVPKGIEECTVNLQSLDLLAKGKAAKAENSFMLFMENALGQKKNEDMTKELLAAIRTHVYSGRSRWPYLDSSVFPSVMSRISVILGDMPTVHLRCITANSITVNEARYMMAHVISELHKHYVNNAWLLTLEHATSMLYPHLLAPKDHYMAALLREAALKYEKIDAWIGASHVVPVTSLWSDIPVYDKAVRIPPRIEGETDGDLIEKHVILDLLNETQVWSDPSVVNPFPYLTATPTPESLMSAKQLFREHLLFYQEAINENVKIPEALAKELEQLSTKQHS